MKESFRILLLTIFLALYPFISSGKDLPSEAEKGESLFLQKCSSCHTIGSGRLVGPDLMGVTERRSSDWLEEFIMDPQKLIDKKDPIALKLLDDYKIKMPPAGLNREEIKLVISFLSQRKEPRQTEGKDVMILAGDADRGKALFTGSIPFKNGGSPCIACHTMRGISIPGGTLGPDLTASIKNYGKDGLKSVLLAVQFPTMQPLYGKKPLTEQEVADLISFFESADEKHPFPSFATGTIYITGGALLIFALIQIAWKGRLKGVRKDMIKTGSITRK